MLLSDFLLVQVPGEGWLPFRDVFERDGKQVRDREERLAKLFLSESASRQTFDQAKEIMDESARYNIGNVSRNINIPTLVLTLLTPVNRTRMRFEFGKVDETGTIVEFKETSQPTYVGHHRRPRPPGLRPLLDGRRPPAPSCGPSCTPWTQPSRRTSPCTSSTTRLRACSCRCGWKSGTGGPGTPTKCTGWPPTRGSGGSRSPPPEAHRPSKAV